MAGSSLLTLIDDIASILDDVATMTKVATKKTAGVLGDDLALNAQQVTGVEADRELSVVWAVAKGSLKNKLILVPIALAISALIPWLIIPFLMLGGAFLCFEGFEKLAHKFMHSKDEAKGHKDDAEANSEADKIKGAIRTDFILSAEIIVITLGAVANKSFGVQVTVLLGIALIMTVGVYGLVAGIVKLDDGGLYLSKLQGKTLLSSIQRKIGSFLLGVAPYLMKTLSIAGTAAMFMVGGSILAHGIPLTKDLAHVVESSVAAIPAIGHVLESVAPMVFDAVIGIVAGAVVLAGVTVFSNLKQLVSKKA